MVVQNHTAQVVPAGAEVLDAGMPLRISGKEYTIASADTDEYGRSIGAAELDLPDGTYNGTVVVDQTHPIDFLLTSK